MTGATQRTEEAILSDKIALLANKTCPENPPFIQKKTFESAPGVLFMTVHYGVARAREARFQSRVQQNWLDSYAGYRTEDSRKNATILGRMVTIKNVRGLTLNLAGANPKMLLLDCGYVAQFPLTLALQEKLVNKYPSLSIFDAQVRIPDYERNGEQFKQLIAKLRQVHPEFHILHSTNVGCVHHELMLVRKKITGMDDMLTDLNHDLPKYDLIRGCAEWLHAVETHFPEHKSLAYLLGMQPSEYDESYQFTTGVYMCGLRWDFGTFTLVEKALAFFHKQMDSVYSAQIQHSPISLKEMVKVGIDKAVSGCLLAPAQIRMHKIEEELAKGLISHRARAALISGGLF